MGGESGKTGILRLLTCNNKGSNCRSVENDVLAEVSWKCQKIGAVSLKYKVESACGPRTMYRFVGRTRLVCRYNQLT